MNFISEDFGKSQKEDVNKAILSALSDGLTDVGILGEEALYILYILNGSALTQFAVLQIMKAYDAGIKVINEVLLRMKSSDTLNDE